VTPNVVKPTVPKPILPPKQSINLTQKPTTTAPIKNTAQKPEPVVKSAAPLSP